MFRAMVRILAVLVLLSPAIAGTAQESAPPATLEVTLYDQGLELYRLAQFEEALILFERHINENPQDIKVDDARWRMGRSLVALGRLSEAEEAFREVVAIPNGNRRDEASFDLGQLLFDLDRFDESFAILTRFVQEFPTSNRADDATWYLGQIHADAGRISEAETAFRAVMARPDSNRQDEATYSLGELLYLESRNEEALQILLNFREVFPDDAKADDALWRIGRLRMRFNEPEAAEQAFLGVLELPNSNRHSEATYDLGRLRYADRDYEAVIGLFAPLHGRTDLDLYQRRSVALSARSSYYLGLAAQGRHRDTEAAELFSNAARWYEQSKSVEPDPLVRGELEFWIGKSFDHLSELARDREVSLEYRSAAEQALESAIADLEDPQRADASVWLDGIRANDQPSFRVDVSGLGGVENLSASPGAQLDAGVSVTLPIGFRQSLSAGIDFGHDDFVVKTFNFNPAKTGTDRLIQTTNTLAADIGWRAGDSRSFRNDLNLSGSVRWAEDPGDNRYQATLDDAVRWRFAPDWRIDWASDVQLTIYPDYLSGSNTIDSFNATSRPEITFYALDPIELTLAYEFDLKQYLQSTYGASTLNRQYLTNSAAIEARRTAGVFRPTLAYEVSILESNNYDFTASGLPASQLVLDYWDNVSHDVNLDLDFRWTPTIRTRFGGDFTVRNFTNYPARDDTKTFTGELRQDITMALDAELSMVVWERDGIAVSAIVDGWWRRDTSNMTYETTFVTNYDSYGGLAGVSLKMR